ncbi:MAG: hypothetical protein VYE40_16325 [Myxococcota bacterium]|nr:hypothetical protein [Myxococcota bacterium]
MDMFERQRLWTLIEKEATKTSFREGLLPYIESKLADLEGPLAVVTSIEAAKAILPFATFEQSLIPTIEATAKALSERNVASWRFQHLEPRALESWQRKALASKFRLEPRLLDLFCWCDGFTLELLDDLDEEGTPYPEEDNDECTFRRLTLHGIDAYLDPLSPDILPGADADLSEAYMSFTDTLASHFDDDISEDELEADMQDAMRIVATFESNANDLTCANIMLQPDGRYVDTEDEWGLMFGGRVRVLRGCTSSYIGSMIVRDQEFGLYRNLVDSEIAEVVTDGTLEMSSLSNIIHALLIHGFGSTRPSKDIEQALHSWRQNQ